MNPLPLQQQNWPGANWYNSKIRSANKSLLTIIPGWNTDAEGNRINTPLTDQDMSLATWIMSKRRAPAPR